MNAAAVFIRKLEAFAPLNETDHEFVETLFSKIISVPVKKPFGKEGDAPGVVHILLSGMACRYKVLDEGKRQISAFILPGDFCDPHLFILNRVDHSVAALCECTLAELSKQQASQMLERPKIAKALLFSSLVEESVLREWISNVGQRRAVQRMAHLFCEIYLRMKFVGLATANIVKLPLSQSELGDSLGLSLVHTNKSLAMLRQQNVVEFQRGILTLIDIKALMEICGFNAAYLHLDGGKS